MHPTIQALYERAGKTSERLRNTPNTDRANRFRGRAERVITLHAARLGEPVPTLYITTKPDGLWLTTWPGQKIARVYQTGKAPAFNCTLICYSATIEGRNYYGRGHGLGMYINLHAGKLIRK